jgi:parallel beta-helix repeat protein
MQQFTVYKDGTTYKSKNISGAIAYSGSNAATVIQSSINALTPGRTTNESVILQGSIALTSTIKPTNFTTVASTGTVTATKSMDNMIYTNGTHNVEVAGGVWNHAGLAGNNPNTFLFQNCNYINTHNCDVRTGAIAVYLTNHATILSNTVSKSSGSSIAVLLTCSDIVVSRNVCSDSDAGIYLYCQRGDNRADLIQNCVVTNNTVMRTQRDGISLYTEGAEDKLRNCLVDSNTCVDCGIDGDHYGVAVGMGGGNDPTLVGHVDYNTITNNNVSETGTYKCGGGIGVRGTYNVVKTNTIKNTYDPGMVIQNGNYNTLDSNTVTTTRLREGIEICDASYNVVSNNTVSNTAGAGVWITGAQYSKNYSNANNLKSNSISGVNTYWVKITESGDTGNILDSNVFIGKGSIYNKGTGTIIK